MFSPSPFSFFVPISSSPRAFYSRPGRGESYTTQIILTGIRTIEVEGGGEKKEGKKRKEEPFSSRLKIDGHFHDRDINSIVKGREKESVSRVASRLIASEIIVSFR